MLLLHMRYKPIQSSVQKKFNPLSLLANLPLDEVTEIALLIGKEFKIVYNSVSRLIIDGVE